MSRARPQMGTQGDVLGARIAALLIDLLITTVVGVVIVLLFLAVGIGSGSRALTGILTVLLIPISLVLQFGYFIYFEAERGQTPGKSVMDIVVVTEDGGDLDYGTSAIRNILRIVDQLGVVIPYLVGLLLILVTDDSQRIGDLVADTVVVKTE
ncbi:RDD family protein [Halobaculum sp. MBLA0147]|uniref:RDD family protein n=1 Tax=Halobaculum sp. MBLA0147 TaxID=3079934 RepID=UPI003523E5A5